MLEALWGGPETLIVVSSDLSHYLPYAQAKQIDHDTVDESWVVANSTPSNELAAPYPSTGCCWRQVGTS